jgi:GNAT superfamily N-acetyltransferase
MESLRLTYTAEPDSRDRAAIHEQIRAFNDAVSAHHRATRKDGARPLDIYVHDGQGRLRGGLVADTYWGWLEIDDLWLEEGLRGMGNGRRLMAMAEAEAKTRGCTRALVRTFSFQARGFYEKLGYRVAGALEDYPPGQALYWMRKDFQA